MPLRDQLLEIATQWPEYRSLGTVDSNHPTYKLVTKALPQTLHGFIAAPDAYQVKGSTGQTRITAAPWLGTFNLDITNGASKGYYVVYLYSEDLERLYLILGIGTRQFELVSSGKKEQYARMQKACGRLRDVFAPHIPERLRDRLEFADPELAETRTSQRHREYEKGAIYYLSYDLSDLPDEAQLVTDYRDMVAFYGATVEDPVTPRMESLLAGTVDLDTIPRDISATPFVPRPPKKSSSSTSGSFGARRSHTEAKEVGDDGERVVLEYERRKLLQVGRSDLVNDIVHEEAKGSRPGWDITSFGKDGEKIYIEVKATTASRFDVFELTANEWRAAHAVETRDRYYVYLVTSALTKKPQIEIIEAPHQLLTTKILDARPVGYAVSLSPSTDTDA